MSDIPITDEDIYALAHGCSVNENSNLREPTKMEIRLAQMVGTACEERDRYKAEVSWLISNVMTGKDIHFALTQKDCPEHLRKRLEGKK